MVLFGLSGAAAAEPDWPMREGLGFHFYGQINQAYLHYDDGTNARGFLGVDNAVNDNGSFMGFVRGGTFANGWTYDGRLEWSLGLQRSDQVRLQSPTGPGYKLNAEDIRHAEVVIRTHQIGTFYFGQGDMSGNLNAPDYSGTEVIQGTNVSQIAASMLQRLDDGTLTTRKLSGAFGSADSGRRFRIRYDSPTFANGLAFSTSLGREVLTSGDHNTYFDVMGSYTHVGANNDYAFVVDWTNGANGDRGAKIAFGYLNKPTGINVAITRAGRSNHRHYATFKLGITRDLLGIGSTSIAYDYYNSGDWAAPRSEGASHGISVVQRIDSLNMDVYATLRSYDAYTNTNNPAESFQNSMASMIGLRWKF